MRGVKGTLLHHPDINPALFRRKSAALLLDMLAWYGQAALTRGQSPLWSSCFPTRNAYRAAVRRLRKAGIIAHRRKTDHQPLLLPAPEGAKRDPLIDPRRLWNETWNGWWYVLSYDIPETDRKFRDGLRRSLARLGLGQLHKSVWISPRDIRAVYEDLHEAAGIRFVSYLLEARTVLGRRPEDLVREAWDFEAVARRHRWYTNEYRALLDQALSRHPSAETASRLAQEELLAYRAAMEGDPLLPRKLLPTGYEGRDVFELHRRFVNALRHRLTPSVTGPREL